MARVSPNNEREILTMNELGGSQQSLHYNEEAVEAQTVGAAPSVSNTMIISPL